MKRDRRARVCKGWLNNALRCN